jgi:hypothetical protein
LRSASMAGLPHSMTRSVSGQRGQAEVGGKVPF